MGNDRNLIYTQCSSYNGRQQHIISKEEMEEIKNNLSKS